MYRLKLSAIMRKRRGEMEYPYLNPMGLKKVDATPLIKVAMLTNVKHFPT
jgi:hypothetical protein